MALGAVIPFAKPTYFHNGVPADGYLLYTFAAGTSTPLATYQDANLLSANTNPIVLDSEGQANIWTTANTYKLVFCIPADPVPVTPTGIVWTQDGVPATNLSQSIVGIGGLVWNFGGSPDVPITQTSYTSGATMAALHAGSSVLSIDSALLSGTFGIAATIQSISSITTTVAVVNLSDGAPDTPIATVTSTSAAGATVTSSAISFAASGSSKDYGIKVLVSSGTGYAWNVQLVRLT